MCKIRQIQSNSHTSPPFALFLQVKKTFPGSIGDTYKCPFSFPFEKEVRMSDPATVWDLRCVAVKLAKIEIVAWDLLIQYFLKCELKIRRVVVKLAKY